MGYISELLKQNSNHYRILSAAGEIGENDNIPTYVVGGYIGHSQHRVISAPHN